MALWSELREQIRLVSTEFGQLWVWNYGNSDALRWLSYKGSNQESSLQPQGLGATATWTLLLGPLTRNTTGETLAFKSQTLSRSGGNQTTLGMCTHGPGLSFKCVPFPQCCLSLRADATPTSSQVRLTEIIQSTTDTTSTTK